MTLRRWQSGFLLIVYFYLLSGQLSFRNLKRLRFGMCLSKPLRSTFRWTGINRVPVFANMWEQNTETGCNGKDILMSSIFIAKYIINNNTKKQAKSHKCLTSCHGDINIHAFYRKQVWLAVLTWPAIIHFIQNLEAGALWVL